MTSSNGMWSMIGRLCAPPPPGVRVADALREGGTIEADVAIVTNCAFVGGNAASTVTEFLALREAGLKVVIVHCPVKRSAWKRHWIADRFLPHQADIVPAHAVGSLRCRTLIARGPRMAMTRGFARLLRRITAEEALFVVNNSAWNEDGKPLFDWAGLHRRVAASGIPRARICPISPVIRAEAQRAMAGTGLPDGLSAQDWPPAFRIEPFRFEPRAHLTAPIVIGRHARDHASKWLEDPADLRAAYPEAEGLTVSIMGGAATAERRLGGLPGNWVVHPFGASGVEEYLAGLDVFVYFPARTRDEAFGRTIVEAVLSGLPVILPPFFAPTFGDLALYCEPADVADVVARLAADDAGRMHYIHACRQEAIARFGTGTLLPRLAALDTPSDVVPRLDAAAQAFRAAVMPAG
ncbi:glycosyltransferase [Falsirhodobacter algicola]|uniref:Glycosyltransferase n=1 Tax=Falsirhodobacter algicola TaxID=2692330 RepID=A0A8J8SKM7_9RHOB|nr:glycosyltransferase [Falsirhodobacter algicola]QUS36130.1 glycosyltransferase [Falsirhodobacter algicola]